MKENNGEQTKKRKILYSLLLSICILLLAAATVLTVYFSSVNKQTMQTPENPPVDEPNEQEPTPPPVDEPSKPSDGDGVRFIAPLTSGVCTVEYDAVYTNLTLNQIRMHKGIDFSAEEGASVTAVAAGKVERISLSQELGNLIIVDHGDGLKSIYRFVEPKEGLKEGQQVQKGEEIACVAAAYGTEYKDGAHLHFEMQLNGEYKDPSEYFEVVYEEK